ncbi:nucleotide exchange factor GrpE [Candidatus Roizmanbacteria bacterium]|nr:nucleotide exchange factor GrpE [Candidatus Roizmanbacteria bacterium]
MNTQNQRSRPKADPPMAETIKEKEGEQNRPQEVEKKEEKVDQIDYKDKYLRALADYQNLVKRVTNEREEFTRYANESLIIKLLPILDGLEKAIETNEEKGIQLIYKELWNILSHAGVQRIDIQETDEFNPEYMQCIQAEQQGKKIQTLRPGYRLYDKIIRPAQVKVVQ